MKDLVSHDAPRKIKHIQFGVLSQQDIVKISELECSSEKLYNIGPGERRPVRGGILDRRLVSLRARIQPD